MVTNSVTFQIHEIDSQFYSGLDSTIDIWYLLLMKYLFMYFYLVSGNPTIIFYKGLVIEL